MKRTMLALTAALGFAALTGCEQQGAVPEEAVQPEIAAPAPEAGALGGKDAIDIGNGASGEVPTEGGGLTES